MLLYFEKYSELSELNLEKNDTLIIYLIFHQGFSVFLTSEKRSLD